MASHEEAFRAVMVAIKDQAEAIGAADHLNENTKAAALRDLAAAYRHLRGGAQPGGVSVDK
ncbi:hypothetical protein [Microbacterium sp. NPDC057944]|uniref:hypothetical protein n=1 Tax=Microbacterium sp. NPDC057944 TaxID=3346286 RepID=UPI0036DC2BCD